jgi:hypothetical protein
MNKSTSGNDYSNYEFVADENSNVIFRPISRVPEGMGEEKGVSGASLMHDYVSGPL